jgi:hypothetical protein
LVFVDVLQVLELAVLDVPQPLEVIVTVEALQVEPAAVTVAVVVETTPEPV